MTLHDAIMQLYPDADPLHDFVLPDDGYGAFIAEWNLDAPRPTKAALVALGVEPGSRMASVVREWADLNRALLDKAQDVIDATARPRRLGQANNIPAIIDTTTPGDEVGDSGWTRERAAAVNAMWASFETWLQTPLEDAAGLAPVQVLSMRE